MMNDEVFENDDLEERLVGFSFDIRCSEFDIQNDLEWQYRTPNDKE